MTARLLSLHETHQALPGLVHLLYLPVPLATFFASITFLFAASIPPCLPPTTLPSTLRPPTAVVSLQQTHSAARKQPDFPTHQPASANPGPLRPPSCRDCHFSPCLRPRRARHCNAMTSFPSKCLLSYHPRQHDLDFTCCAVALGTFS